MAAAAVSLCVLDVAANYAGESVYARSAGERKQIDRQAYRTQLLAMREMHQRVLTAKSPEAKYSLIQESEPVLRLGVEMMLQMRETIPALATASLVSDALTEPEAERVRDFIALMGLLLEMKRDRESVPQSLPQRVPPMDPPPIPQLVHSGAGGPGDRPEA